MADRAPYRQDPAVQTVRLVHDLGNEVIHVEVVRDMPLQLIVPVCGHVLVKDPRPLLEPVPETRRANALGRRAVALGRRALRSGVGYQEVRGVTVSRAAERVPPIFTDW